MNISAAPFTPRIAPLTVLLFLGLQGADATLAAAWGVLALGAFGCASCGMLDLQRPLSRIEWGMLGMVGACALSIAFGVDARHSLQLSVPALASALLWILIVRARRAPSMALHVVLGLLLAAVAQLALLLLAAQRAPGTTAPQWVAGAGAAWLVVPNDVAWIACVLPLLAALARQRERAVLAVALLAYLGVCVLLRSRSAALVALAAAALSELLAAVRVPQPRWRWPAAFAAAGTLGACALLAFASMRARLQLWTAAWSIFLDHPLTGVGLHDFVIVYRQYLPDDAQLVDPRLTPWPHQLLLEIAAECGVIGVLAALILVAAVWRQAVRAPFAPLHRRVVAGLCGMLLLALVEATLLRQWVWLLGTALCALLTLEAGERDKGKQQE